MWEFKVDVIPISYRVTTPGKFCEVLLTAVFSKTRGILIGYYGLPRLSSQFYPIRTGLKRSQRGFAERYPAKGAGPLCDRPDACLQLGFYYDVALRRKRAGCRVFAVMQR